MYSQNNNGRRNYYDIFSDVGESVVNALCINDMMIHAGLSYSQSISNMKHLLSMGFLRREGSCIEPTEDMIEFLRHYRMMRDTLEPGYSDSLGPLEEPGCSQIRVDNKPNGKNVYSRRQNRYDIFATFVKSSNIGKVNVNKLRNDANLSGSQLETYLHEVDPTGILELQDDGTYLASEKGIEFWKHYTKMRELINRAIKNNNLEDSTDFRFLDKSVLSIESRLSTPKPKFKFSNGRYIMTR